MCVARILWDDEPVIATRWNGDDDRPLGNPTSSGQPTWFVVDGYVAGQVEQAARAAAENSPTGLAAGYRQMAADKQRESETEEWIEGLIYDAGDDKR